MTNVQLYSSGPDTSSCPPASFPPHSDTAARLTILIVDDEISEQDALIHCLRAEGFDAVCVGTGRAGIRSAASAAISAIVLDLHLPDILGLSVLSEFRRMTIVAPVITVTGWYLDSTHEDAARALGAAAFLRKPLDACELTTILRRVIAGEWSAPVQTASPPDARPTTAGVSTSPRHGPGNNLTGLHQQVLSGDSAAMGAIASCLQSDLECSLSRAFRRADDSWVHDAVVDALMEYWKRPGRYDPSTGVPLSGYLRYAARRNLINRVDAERRRAERELAAARSAWPPIVCPASLVSSAHSEEWTRDVVAALGELTPSERAVLRLRAAGERRTEVFARAVGLGLLTVENQRTAVKLIKDRILHRIRRALRRASQNPQQRSDG